MSGVGNLSGMDLNKFMKDKRGRVSFDIARDNSNIFCDCNAKDLETMMQLINLKYTAPVLSEIHLKKAVEFEKERIREKTIFLKNSDIDTLSLYATKPNKPTYTAIQQEEMLNTASFDKIKDIYHKLFDGVDGTTFFCIGDIDISKLKDYTEKYIATLPKGEPVKGSGGIKTELREGRIDKIFTEKK